MDDALAGRVSEVKAGLEEGLRERRERPPGRGGWLTRARAREDVAERAP